MSKRPRPTSIRDALASENVASSDLRDYPVKIVARRLMVDRRTVIKFVHSGLFPHAYLLPGCGYRIPDADVKIVREQLRISLHTST